MNTVVKGPALRKSRENNSNDIFGIDIINEDGHHFSLTEEQISRGMLAIGAPGFGKTVALLQIAKELRSRSTPEDVFVFFDTKGDYKRHLFTNGDAVLDYKRSAGNGTVTWNIFREILADGYEADNVYDNAYELSTILFSNKIDVSPNPFFPKNGRDVIMGILFSIAMRGISDPQFFQSEMNNQYLANFFRGEQFTPVNIASILKEFPETRGIVTSFYNGKPDAVLSPQSQGVLSEAAEVGREIFKGSFAAAGDFSMREFVRNKGAKALFVEYNLSVGNTLFPIYRALCDLALKEALARETNVDGGRVYLFLDELRLLPALQYLENAINFGRGMGLTIIAGIQNSDQINQAYGEEAMRSVLSSFGTAMIFNTSSGNTRQLIKERLGENQRLENVPNVHGRMEELVKTSSVIEDWDITLLAKGQSIIHTVGEEPYKYRFPYRKEGLS